MAQRSSTLVVQMHDNSPLTLTINDRQYNKQGTRLTIANLPPGRHYLKVYEYKPYRDEQGGHAKLVYSGTVRVKKNTYNIAVVDPTSRSLRLQTSEGNTPISNAAPANEAPTTAPSGNTNNIIVNTPQAAPGSSTYPQSALKNLQQKVQAKETDTERMKLLRASLNGKQLSTAQIRAVLSWLSFEASRLEMAKWAYPIATDKTEYAALENIFQDGQSQADFREFMAAQQ